MYIAYYVCQFSHSPYLKAKDCRFLPDSPYYIQALSVIVVVIVFLVLIILIVFVLFLVLVVLILVLVLVILVLIVLHKNHPAFSFYYLSAG